jgi:hypothetical protein
MTAKPSVWSKRALALLLVYLGGWVSLTVGALQLLLQSPYPIVQWTAWLAQAAGVVMCGFGIVGLVRLKRKASPVERELEGGMDVLMDAQRRLGEYARDSFAHVFALPLALSTIGVLLLVVLRGIPRGGTNDVLIVVLGFGYAATVGASLRILAGIWREANRIKRMSLASES